MKLAEFMRQHLRNLCDITFARGIEFQMKITLFMGNFWIVRIDVPSVR